MKIVTVVQARVGSTRLPNKVMKTILSKTILELMVERLLQAKHIGQIVIATSEHAENDIIEDLFRNNDKIVVFRGSELDLLDRHYQAAKALQADIVAKIPSDCPLIDPKIIDDVYGYFLSHSVDFVSNLHPATYPDGNDVEIFRFSALEKAHLEAQKPLEREHTTPYFWENPDKFSLANFTWPKGYDYSMSHRFTIDYLEDFEFIKAVFEALYPSNPRFSLEDILDLLEKKPEIYQINAHFAGVNWYRNHLDELKTIDASKTKKID
ncbi:MAG: glycosyltransferase family protein [Chitinophagales bacterium]|jgi:spore coat polysaccharide biosynthesis protein SpsF|nr:glycosyltransferase family protein [Chitinophagales bacterium]